VFEGKKEGIVHSMGAVTEIGSGKMIGKLTAPVGSLEKSFELSTAVFSYRVLFVMR